MNEELIEELSPRAEIFRSKLIEDFQLLDMLIDKGGNEVPMYYSNEILGKNLDIAKHNLTKTITLIKNRLIPPKKNDIKLYNF